ncbi:MAG TPA: hypothetical protein ENI89_07690 [Desulfobulbus sp.]|nr:hypothetical protein [Desulfobulbus sp.]
MKTILTILCLLLLALTPAGAAEKTGTARSTAGSSRSQKKTPSGKGPVAPTFSPSEKIGADTVIAFPADI